MALLRAIAVSLSVAGTSALPYHASLKRQASELRPNYDFIIAGGGTSGLTVADRLSKAFPKKSVLVVEYGAIEYAPGVFDPPTLWTQSDPNAVSRWSFNSLPNPEVDNHTAFIAIGKTVGGSSAANGMFFDRGSRFDYDAWTEVGGPELRSSKIKWNWNGMIAYFKKSVTFTEPPPATAQKYGYTWDVSAAYGGTTPIFSSYPPFQWGDQPVLRETWEEMGLEPRRECAGGDKEGICWVPTSEDPITARRSHSGLGHYAAVQPRSNYDLLVKHQVIRVVYPKGLGPKSGPPLVVVRSVDDASQKFNVTAKAEVIISAGAFHTPTVLLRSGIGPASYLRAAGIPTLIDLPGVGSNLQDHSGPGVFWNYTKPGNFSPLPHDMLDPAFRADATTGFNQVPARGPYTLSMGNSAIYVSLPHVAPATYRDLVTKIRRLATAGNTAASYLPPGTDPSVVAGYKDQLQTLANLFSNAKAPSLETPWAESGGSALAFHLHPLSRGTVRLDPGDHLAQPILDYRMLSNPLDMDLHLAHLRFLRKLLDTPTMRRYGAVELAPGPAAAATDDALRAYIRQTMILSFQHPCCTAPMLTRAKGGVVGPDLKVHGTPGGLRIADMSIAPLLIGSHLSATAYAVGEKAADIIIEEWSK
ncbi:hypothetical protein B0H63DRAFT_369427, partial [Podospora didyma]